MAIHNQPIQEGDSGWKKTFEAGSEAMLLDFVQSAQYSTPIPSAVRELTSNAIDSVREKNRFFLINSGQAKVEDYYIERDGDLYKDSNYNPAYYDEKWLSKTDNRIKLIYKEGNNSQRDTLHIIDTGVGLGGLRLEKSFNPLFSTKRNNNQDLGKFGIGSKAGLSLDVDYYTLITRYNGAEFQFNVYAYKVDPVVPRFNMTKGEENPYYEMQTATEKDQEGVERPKRLYYIPTSEPNGVEVVLQAKKGLKKEFVDAVKGQLLYLDGIDFELHENGQVFPQQIKAEIEYESDLFVLPTANSTYYAKPHVILNGICYGYISFLQMEEEDKVGNIGIKMDPSRIDINPNRESVRYTPRTIQAFKDYMALGKDEAEKVMQEALTSTDLMDWALKSAGALVSANSGSVVGRFANISDLKAVKPKFLPMPKIRFLRDPNDFFKSYDVMVVSKTQKWSKSKGANIQSLDRTRISTWGQFQSKHIYYQDVDTTFRLDMYILSIYPNGFVKILPKGEFSNAGKITQEQADMMDINFGEFLKMSRDEQDQYYHARQMFYKEQSETMNDLLKQSSLIDMYSSVVVPDDFRTTEKETEEDETEAAEAATNELSLAERRKLENRIVANAFEYKAWDNWNREKKEPRIKEILNYSGEMIYGFAEDEALLCLAAEVFGYATKNTGIYCKETWSDDVSIVMVSQSNAKYFKPHIYVNDFFLNFNHETKTISMHNKLVKWQTARKLNDALGKIEFLSNFGIFDPEAKKLYTELCKYRDTHYMDLKATMHSQKSEDGAQVLEDLKTSADQITEFQLFVARHPGDLQAIAAKSKALFETNEDNSFKDAIGIEMEIYEKLLLLLDATASVSLMLNELSCLRSYKSITHNLEKEIKDYLDHKGYISISNLTSSVLTLPVQQDELMEA